MSAGLRCFLMLRVVMLRLKCVINSLVSLLLLAAATAAHALPEDRNHPIHISADSASINENTGITVYSGNVEISQGSMLIRGARVELHRNQNGDVNRIISTGAPAEFQQQPRADDPVTKAFGQRMEYRIDAREVTITREARVEQGKDTFTGQRIVYNMDKAVVDAYSSESGETRVQMIIQPKNGAGE